MLITLISHEDQIVKERAADTTFTAKPVLCPDGHGQLNLVEVNGIEPMTPCLQSRCSPS
jgi:hypothetical protein